MDYDKMVRVYIKMRDARTKLKREYDAEDQKIKDQMAVIEAAFLESLNESNTQSMKTASGTAYIAETTKASIADWGALAPWIRENDALEFLEQRIRASQVTAYLEEYKELPPGVNLYRERNVRIRKS